jgi:gliding motility-associated-like protein
VKITVAQPFNMPVIPNAFICKGSEIKLTASGAHRYQWIENTVGLNDLTSPQPIARPTSTITYKVVGYDSHQCFTDTAQVLVTVRDLPTVNAGPDVELSGGESYQLSALISNDVVDWKWTPSDRLSCTSCPTPIAKPNMTTPYVVTVKNNYDCIASDTVVLKVKCAPDNVFIPNGFTPNKDGKNDLFYIKGSGAMIKSMLIYNRWGELVFERSHFEIDDASKAWDGTYKGISVSSGSYVYIAELECSGGESFIRKGTVNVIY